MTYDSSHFAVGLFFKSLVSIYFLFSGKCKGEGGNEHTHTEHRSNTQNMVVKFISSQKPYLCVDIIDILHHKIGFNVT